jgi:hypothetical protein
VLLLLLPPPPLLLLLLPLPLPLLLFLTVDQERLKEKLLAKQKAVNAVHLKEKELAAAEELCSSLKQEIQVCKAATRECLDRVEEVRSRRAQQNTPGMQVQRAA